MRYFSDVISLMNSLKSTATGTHNQPNLIEEEGVGSAGTEGNFHGIRPNQAQRGWCYQKRYDWICEDLHKTQNVYSCMEASLHLCNTEDVASSMYKVIRTQRLDRNVTAVHQDGCLMIKDAAVAGQ